MVGCRRTWVKFTRGLAQVGTRSASFPVALRTLKTYEAFLSGRCPGFVTLCREVVICRGNGSLLELFTRK